MKNEIFIKILSISILIIVCFAILINGASASAPASHKIAGVPQHKQINGLSCGPAALEIVFDYWGADIDQKAIADAARSSSIGTYTWDMMRTGQFSHLSAAQGNFFPHAAPDSGFPERSLGYASFNYSSDKFWWEDLKGIIASNIPVILLMKYAPNDDTGHYRVIVGYDETKEEVYFIDPWARDLKRVTNPDGTITWSMEDFKKAWNYDKYGTNNPYWGAVLMPWSVDLISEGSPTAGSTVKVTADIKYPCQLPFDCSSYPATDASAMIQLPPNMELTGSPVIEIGNLKAGESSTVSWNVRVNADASGSVISVSAGGKVSGSVPEVHWNGNQVSYPAYGYTDEIGGEASIKV